jgi:hypothetical protein
LVHDGSRGAPVFDRADFEPARLVSSPRSVASCRVRPYFELEAFEELRDGAEFAKLRNGGTFVEWECGADLSADTIEAKTQWTLGAREAS